MTSNGKSGWKWRQQVKALLAALAVLILALVVPPFISVSRYRGQITQLIAQSLGRPVHLSSVQVRLLPWPGFELHDLSVAEDPAYGAEPVLYANTVTASLRLLALWRGRLEIGKISVDEASLNLVRTGPGQWNLDPLFHTAAAKTGAGPGSGTAARLPYLEATNSRINFKNGVEKLPFSLVNADLSMWQDSPGNWRIRLRGQPARTDVSLYQEDTGVVRLEASVRRAPALRDMPIHLDLDWRQAQLGQLARIVTGSDPGWRGDLTGELHMDGTADAAKVAMRLRASGVHRAEFEPASTLDFDANCNFTYHYTRRSLEGLACDSPLGDGRVRLTGDKPGPDAPPHMTLELDRLPVAAGLDALRTVRSGIQPDLEAAGTVSGKIVYSGDISANAPPAAPPKKAFRRGGAQAVVPVQGPLTGSLVVENFSLKGGGLTRPVQAAKMTLDPAPPDPAAANSPNSGTPAALAGIMTVPAGGTAPLTINLRLALAGYQASIQGQASWQRARELAHAAGVPEADALNALAGDPVTLDLIAAGPWLPPEQISAGSNPLAAAPGSDTNSSVAKPMASAPRTANPPATDQFAGTVVLRNANWKSDYLASHLAISQATLHLEQGAWRWVPVFFAYGPVKGTATLTVPPACQPGLAQPCPPQPAPVFTAHFAALNGAALQTALLGAQESGTLLSTLIERLHPSAAPPWPHLRGTVTADSFILGPVTLDKFSAALELSPVDANITSLDASLYGGHLHAAGTLVKPETDRDKPEYRFEGDFENLDAAALGHLLGLRWTGSAVSGTGNIYLTGYTGTDLASSAKGALHIESKRGGIVAPGEAADANPAPAALAHFDRIVADAVIANGSIRLGQNQIVSGARQQSLAATVTLGDPPALSFAAPKQAAPKQAAPKQR